MAFQYPDKGVFGSPRQQLAELQRNLPSLQVISSERNLSLCETEDLPPDMIWLPQTGDWRPLSMHYNLATKIIVDLIGLGLNNRLLASAQNDGDEKEIKSPTRLPAWYALSLHEGLKPRYRITSPDEQVREHEVLNLQFVPGQLGWSHPLKSYHEVLRPTSAEKMMWLLNVGLAFLANPDAVDAYTNEHLVVYTGDSFQDQDNTQVALYFKPNRLIVRQHRLFRGNDNGGHATCYPYYSHP